MARRKATEEEMQEAWKNTCVFWDSLGESKLDKPWAEAKFKLALLKTTLSMKGLINPYGN